jgi:spore coat polysaccharide biosynthesis protein SpsF
MIERVSRVPVLDGIIVATTENTADDSIVALARRLGVGWYRGSEDDVLSRVLEAAGSQNADVIVELTGDCPLIDPDVIAETIETYLVSDADYVSNILERTYPIGMDTQVFATNALADVARRTEDPLHREHVSLFFYRHPEIYRLKNVAAQKSLARPNQRLTLDTTEDLALIRTVFEGLYPDKPDFGLGNILAFLDSQPEIAKLNSAVAHRYV